MRKDVEKLAGLYPRLDATTDLERLRWPLKPSDQAARFATLLSAVDFDQYSTERPLKLLDVGCGLGLLLDYLSENSLIDRVDYTGTDLVKPIVQEVRARWPGRRFDLRDVRDEPYPHAAFDYSTVCGIFTAKHGNTYDETLVLAQSTLRAVWPSVTLGLGFNSMSKHVDWERDDLFHWPLDDIMRFCKRELSRHVSFRLDYGLWEGATLVRREPDRPWVKTPSTWGTP
jgi:SAM-dependent methyltransferase